MPSPFPGMDPFLEKAVFFGDLHDSTITYLREALQPLLPEPYYAATADRVWVELSQRYVQPDTNILRSTPKPPEAGATGVAVAASTAAKPVVVHVPWEEHRETSLQIYTRLDDTER